MTNIVTRFVAEMLPFWLERKARRDAAMRVITPAPEADPEAGPGAGPGAGTGQTPTRGAATTGAAPGHGFTPAGTTTGRLRRGPDADDHRWRASSM